MSHHPKVYFTRKRRRDEDNEKHLKQPKKETASTNEGESTSTFQTKLTDINDDCLEKIFMHLSLHDFLNIAHTNKGLKTAADLAFGCKYGKKRFSISIHRLHPEWLDLSGEDGHIHDLKTSLRLLRCYGHLMSDLMIGCNESYYSASTKVLRYVNEYCYKSLKEIAFFNLLSYVFEKSLKKPFTKVEVVFFARCVLGKKISNLNKWFPAMRCLSFHVCRFTDLLLIEAHFPHLERLYIPCDLPKSRFSPENLTAAFRLNPQLQSLVLNELQSPITLQSASQYLPVLEDLTIWRYTYTGRHDEDIHFKSVKKLKTKFIYGDNEKLPLPRINLSFDKLEEVYIDSEDYGIIDEAIAFFKKHQTITKLELRSVADSDACREYFMKVVTALPRLNDIYFSGYDFSIDETIHFLAEFKTVNKFCFYISNPDEFHRLERRLGDNWETSIKNSRVELKRRT